MSGRLGIVEDRTNRNAQRLDDIEQRMNNLDKLITSVEVLATRQETVESVVQEIKSDVKGLTTKSGKRWDAIVDKVIWAIFAAVIAFLLAKAGL